MSSAMMGAHGIQSGSAIPQTGLIEQTGNHLESAHDFLSALEGIASMHVGEGKSDERVPTAVSNGQAEAVRNEALRLTQRLSALLDRMKRL